ncbi:ABC transporter permease [Naasia lichenicola]|uniref:ABC transporter permease n=1 Tax=Naasia lichenicola TaxID=2565933 RepID=A0A4S4FGV6_9MICO|nr:ABC transporter permease [Naasia lichenicola]THG29520.1 ABC transporter permease [Naasia lichenicola]
MSAPSGERARLLPFRSAVALVASREIRMALRSKAFLISTGILMLAVLASIVIGGFASRSGSDTAVAVVAETSSIVDGVDGLTVTSADSESDAEQLVRDGKVSAAVLPSDEPLGYRIVALDESPGSLVQRLSVSPSVELLTPSQQDGALVYFVALGFGLVFFMSSITFGSAIAQSVVEEKQTRVVEILLSAIPARALLAGKVIGNSVLAFGQIVAIALLASVGIAINGAGSLLSAIGAPIVWFVVFFTVGFVLLAALFAATAATVSRQQDVATATAPVTTLVMIPYLAILFFTSNEAVLTVMSYVPFSSPVGMPMRLYLGQAQWWEPLLSLAIVIASTVVVIAVGARIYENSLLRMGSKVSLRAAYKR